MGETFQLFNLGTMSGVFPGTRTMVYQRVRVMRQASGCAADVSQQRWARILWYDDPPACVVELEERQTLDTEPRLVRVPAPDPVTLTQVLPQALAAAGWELITCGGCIHWQPARSRTPDGLTTGHCTWQPPAGAAVPPDLAVQSMFALACTQWGESTRDAAARDTATQDTATQDAATRDVATQDTVAQAIAPIRKRAEQENDERWTLGGQFRRWLGLTPPAAPQAERWQERILERSGVGAGTEPCFACQGRIANLGALAVATPEGDKQTFSVWRCRTCYTYYLNDWIDRWERTDNLETEERYYRLNPAEALEVLAVIEDVAHAEHPARRHERNAQRAWMLSFIAARPLLSHQIRQGR